jgi:hypothetical protein
MFDTERAETDDRDLLTFTQRRPNRIYNGVDGPARIRLGKIRTGRDCFNEFRFVHSYPLSMSVTVDPQAYSTPNPEPESGDD